MDGEEGRGDGGDLHRVAQEPHFCHNRQLYRGTGGDGYGQPERHGETVAYTVTAAGGGVTVTAAFTAAPAQTNIPQGTTVIFTDQSTAQNSSIASRLWEILPLPSGVAVATGSGLTFNYDFPTAGSWRVR